MMGRSARLIMERSRARRRAKRRKEGSYASSLPADDGGFLHSDSGLTLYPGSQIQQVEVVGTGSTGPDGAGSVEQEYSSPRQRRSVRLGARNAGSTTKLALETRRTRSAVSSPALQTNSRDYDSDQGKRNRRDTNPPDSATPSLNTVLSPAASITSSSIGSVSLPRTSFTETHTQTSDLECQLPSVEQDTMSLFHTENYDLGLPAHDRMSYAPTFLQSPFQQPFHTPPPMAPQTHFQSHFNPPTQPNTYMKYAVMGNGSTGNVVHPSETDQDITWRKMSDAITHRDQVIKYLQNNKCALEAEVKRLNNSNNDLSHELGRLLDKNRILGRIQQQSQLCGPSFGSPSSGSESSQPEMEHAIEAPVFGSNPFAQIQNSMAQADNHHILALQRTAERRNRDLAQLQEEMARTRSERDHFKANAEGAAIYIKNIMAMNAAATRAPQAKEAGRTALDILSLFRVQTPQAPPRVTTAQEQAPGRSDSQVLLPTQLYLPPPSASKTHLVSTAPSVKTAPLVSTALPVAAAQSNVAASSVPAQHSASSQQQHVMIDLTTEEPSPSIATNAKPGRTASCPNIGDSTALTAVDAVVAPKKRAFSWLGHHPLSKDPHPRGWKNIESTPAAMFQKRLASGLVDPLSDRKGKQKAKKATEKPANGRKRGKGKNSGEGRPAKKQKLGKDHPRAVLIPGPATDNDAGIFTSTDVAESDGLDEEMERLFAIGDDNGEVADSQEEPSIFAAATKDDGFCTSTDEQESDGLDEELDRLLADEIERALAEHSSDDSVPLGAADGREVPLLPVATYHAEDGGEVLNDSNSSVECGRCGLEIGHGGETCQFEDDGLDDLFDDGEDD